jgi:hypothetical protein
MAVGLEGTHAELVGQCIQLPLKASDSFRVGRAFIRVLPGLFPVANGLFGAGRLGVVMRYQFGLGLHHFGKPCF